MQRIMQAQALGDGKRQAYMQGKRTMEINPRHPLVVSLLEKVKADENDPAAAETARLLYDTALLESGYPLHDQQAFATKVRAGHLLLSRLNRECIAHCTCWSSLVPVENRRKIQTCLEWATGSADCLGLCD